MKALIQMQGNAICVAGAMVARVEQPLFPDFAGDSLELRKRMRAEPVISGHRSLTQLCIDYPPKMQFCLEDDDKQACQRILQHMRDFMISGGFRHSYHGVLSAKTNPNRTQVPGGFRLTNCIGGMGVLPKLTYRERSEQLRKELISGLGDNFVYTGFGMIRK